MQQPCVQAATQAPNGQPSAPPDADASSIMAASLEVASVAEGAVEDGEAEDEQNPDRNAAKARRADAKLLDRLDAPAPRRSPASGCRQSDSGSRPAQGARQPSSARPSSRPSSRAAQNIERGRPQQQVGWQQSRVSACRQEGGTQHTFFTTFLTGFFTTFLTGFFTTFLTGFFAAIITGSSADTAGVRRATLAAGCTTKASHLREARRSLIRTDRT